MRFSDMLGGNGEPGDDRATTDPNDPIGELEHLDEEAEAESEDVPAAEVETPEDVLEKLTQFATSARAADQVVTPPTPPMPPSPPPSTPPAQPAVDSPPPPPEPPGDDLLPRGKRKRK